MAKDALETQQLVKNNCEEVTQQLKKLREWQKEIKEKEKSVKMNNTDNVSIFEGGDGFFFTRVCLISIFIKNASISMTPSLNRQTF